jgi:hypothetical protein
MTVIKDDKFLVKKNKILTKSSIEATLNNLKNMKKPMKYLISA